jgi:hypothetical protein
MGMEGLTLETSSRQIYRAVSGMVGFAVGFENVLVYQIVSLGSPVEGAAILVVDNDSIIPDANFLSSNGGYFFTLNTYTGSVTITVTKTNYTTKIEVVDTTTATYPYLISIVAPPSIARFAANRYGFLRIKRVIGSTTAELPVVLKQLIVLP